MDGFAGFLAWLGIVAGFAAVVTKTVDLIRNAIDEDDSLPKVTWNVTALVVGVGYCLGWQLDVTAAVLKLVPALAESSERLQGVAGQVISGLIVGGSAGFFHEVFDLISSRAKAANGVLLPSVVETDRTL